MQLAVNAPGRFLYRPELTDAQLDRLCAGGRDCPTRLPALPKRWGPFPIEPGNVASRVLLRPDGVLAGGGAADARR